MDRDSVLSMLLDLPHTVKSAYVVMFLPKILGQEIQVRSGLFINMRLTCFTPQEIHDCENDLRAAQCLSAEGGRPDDQL